MERQLAPNLYMALCAVRDAILAGATDYAAIIAPQAQKLQHLGFMMDYFVVCRTNDLQPAASDDQNLVILLAAKLGTTRLIDNISLSKQLPEQN